MNNNIVYFVYRCHFMHFHLFDCHEDVFEKKIDANLTTVRIQMDEVKGVSTTDDV